MDFSSRVTLMSYRDTCESIYAVSEEEIKKLRELLPPDYGVVVHQIYTWYHLQD